MDRHPSSVHVVHRLIARRLFMFVAASLMPLVLALGLSLVAGSSCAEPTNTGRQAEQGLLVLPFPDTPDASPQTQIVFQSLAPADLRDVSVEGSNSGPHSGRLDALPNNGGASFVPEVPFSAGETVSVRAGATSDTAARSAGVEHGTKIVFDFTIASPPPEPSSTPTTAAAQGASSQEAAPPTWSFRSRPELHPPAVSIPIADADSDSGLIFVDAEFAPQNGPLILDTKGNVVWFKGLPEGQWGMDLQVQNYQGQPVLTWWEGTVDSSGHGSGEGIIIDSSYRQIATVRAGNGYRADLHEFLLTPRGTAWITVYQVVRADLTSVGGNRDGPLIDSIIQEIDIATGRVLWEWHALGHIPVARSYADEQTVATGYDFFHVNSIQETPDGDLIVSSRNTWAVYLISRATGKLQWQLGGKGNSFQLGPGVQFEFQHHVRLQADGTLTLFNNASSPKQEDQSRGMVIKLDTDAMTATLSTSYTHSPPLLAGSQGSVQLLPNGNWFVGWGDQPNFSEFTPDGTVIFDGRFPGPVQSYRAFRFSWSGGPAEPPAVALEADANGNGTVWVSWNGATDVARWELVGGQDASSATSLSSVAAAGFETALPADTSLLYLAVRALDDSGGLMTTAVVPR